MPSIEIDRTTYEKLAVAAQLTDRPVGAVVNGEVSFWWRSVERVTRPVLPGPTEADVCIVGAGYTGLWTAYYLKRADPSLRVVVLEQRFAGYGASGRNGGWLTNEITGGVDGYRASHGPAAVDAAGVCARYWWTSATAIAPEPTPEATRLTEPCRTSPAANTPGTLVSSSRGGRSSGQPGEAPSRSGPVRTKPSVSSVTARRMKKYRIATSISRLPTIV